MVGGDARSVKERTGRDGGIQKGTVVGADGKLETHQTEFAGEVEQVPW